MNDLISVIVPVYKVEAYLEKCVDSIIAQTHKNLEIILVDDGSPDGCPKLCDELAIRDERIVVIHKENGGLSSARNAGIDVARGEYIGFVDSDDYIHCEMYERMYNALVANGADVCICSYEKVNEQGEALTTATQPIRNEVLTKEQAFAKLFAEQCWYYVITPTKLYKKELFNSLRFATGKLHEDEFFIHHVIGECKNIATIPDRLYMYMEREKSITHSITPANYLCLTDAFLDRSRYFEHLQYSEYALKSLISAYAYIIALITSPYTEEFKRQIADRVKIIAKKFLGYKNLRAFKIWWIYLMNISFRRSQQ